MTLSKTVRNICSSCLISTNGTSIIDRKIDGLGQGISKQPVFMSMAAERQRYGAAFSCGHPIFYELLKCL